VSDSDVPSFGVRVVLGLLFAAMGLFPILAAFDVAPMHARDIHGPPWLGLVAGGIFVLGGIFLVIYDATIRYPWLGSLFALALVGGLGAIGNWIAFGAGTRVCSGDTLVGWLVDSRSAREIECRAAFGIGALMIDGMLVWVLGVGFRQMGMPGRFPSVLEKLGKGLLLLALSPILIVLVAILIGKALYEACATRVRTGAWPRNPDFRKKTKT